MCTHWKRSYMLLALLPYEWMNDDEIFYEWNSSLCQPVHSVPFDNARYRTIIPFFLSFLLLPRNNQTTRCDARDVYTRLRQTIVWKILWCACISLCFVLGWAEKQLKMELEMKMLCFCDENEEELNYCVKNQNLFKLISYSINRKNIEHNTTHNRTEQHSLK